MEFDDTPGLSWELPLMAMMFGWRLWDGMPLCMLEIFICLFTGSECKLKPVLLRYQVRAIMCTRFQCLLIIFDSVSEVQTDTCTEGVCITPKVHSALPSHPSHLCLGTRLCHSNLHSPSIQIFVLGLISV
jgi:hypothetical protein